ncbi:MAG: hypothetical protein HKN04_01090 [Rhodothermaceae bacterium]|nr:hypothetical protein [Rhodothermaceae bacterium]
MNVSIQGTHLALTDAIRQLVHDKLTDALRPLGDTDRDPIHAAIELEHRTRHYDDIAGVRAYRAEATVTGYGMTFRAEGSADELEPAVVAMKHELNRQVREWRGRLRDAQRSGARAAKPRG